MTIRIRGEDLLTSLLAFAMNAVPGALGAGVSLAGDEQEHDGEGGAPGGQPRSIAAVGVAGQLDSAQWQQATGPLWDAFRSGSVVVLPVAEAPESVDASGGPAGLDGLKDVPRDVLAPIGGVILSPGEWGGDLPVILSIYLDRAPDAKSLQVVDRWEPLVSQALSVVEYCSGQEQVAEQMLQMTQYRRVIEQAKGLIMGALGCDAATAFATLARSSQHFNIRLRNLAVALAEHVGEGQVEHPPDPDLRVSPTPQEREVAVRVWAALSTSTAILPKLDR